ncbi:hypothetical protein PhCBS80983_g05595 [Powellomyces hirtus]|uniref:SGT1 protein n=1 Tax=Powellomyces hirtus TaxID=109895 RepID=A0A507DU70_9FUNG|nr:hypothetical protein PhCBS80983_g05595 [Powellomyces hirtus]
MDNIFENRHDVVDTVKYSIYRDFQSLSPGNSLTPAQWLLAAQDFAAEALSYVSQWTSEYIWHKDPFTLSVEQVEDIDVPCVRGTTRFGDCLEDEWLIVSLLVEITRKYPDAVVGVNDNDGEFLLIEAADFLPSWVDPSTSENRVFLHGGVLHMIPIPRTPAEIPLYPSGKVSLQRALAVVRGPAPTEAPSEIQKVILERLAGYPGAAAKNMHNAKCYIPHKIAHILHHEPALVAPAVEAFYTRDPIAMKACYKMEQFPPTTNVMTTVRMNRPQYAQLVSQKFHPPKPFRLPPSTAKDFKYHDLGMKLACGFEMLFADQHLQNLSEQSQGYTVESYNCKVDPGWQAFQVRLNKLNYFRNELPGSKLYKELERNAQTQYLRTKPQTSSTTLSNPIDRIRALLELPLVAEEDLSQAPDMNDRWMEVDPRKLDELLNEQNLKFPEENWTKLDRDDDEMSDMDDEDRRDMEELAKMMGGFNSFVEKESGIDGALFPNEMEPEENSEEDSEEEDQHFPSRRTGSDSKAPLRFDESRFLQTMMGVLGINPDDLGQHNNKGATERDSVDEDIFQKRRKDTRFEELVSEDDNDAADRKEDEVMGSYMREMDRELSSSKMGSTFEKVAPSTSQGTGDDEEAEETAPVDLDLNLVKNILESFSAQEGLPGPAESILSSLGIRLPKQKARSSQRQ